MRTPTTYRLDPDAEAEATTLTATITAASALATEAAALLAFVPPDVNPVVIVRERLAPLQAALDGFAQDARPLLILEGPDA